MSFLERTMIVFKIAIDKGVSLEPPRIEGTFVPLRRLFLILGRKHNLPICQAVHIGKAGTSGQHGKFEFSPCRDGRGVH